jgi:hypothetical protein
LRLTWAVTRYAPTASPPKKYEPSAPVTAVWLSGAASRRSDCDVLVPASIVTVTPGSTHSLPSKAPLPFRSNQTTPCTLPSTGDVLDTFAVVVDVVDVVVVADVVEVVAVGATVDVVVVVAAAAVDVVVVGSTVVAVVGEVDVVGATVVVLDVDAVGSTVVVVGSIVVVVVVDVGATVVVVGSTVVVGVGATVVVVGLTVVVGAAAAVVKDMIVPRRMPSVSLPAFVVPVTMK